MIGNCVQTIAIDATVAAYDIPALVVPVKGKIFWTRVSRNNQILDTYDRPNDKFPGELLAISGSMITNLGKIKRGIVAFPFIMPDTNTILKLQPQNPCQGIINRGIRWDGHAPIGYGFGFIFHGTIINTDRFEISAIYITTKTYED